MSHMNLFNDSFIVFHYKSYGTFCLYSKGFPDYNELLNTSFKTLNNTLHSFLQSDILGLGFEIVCIKLR